MSDNKKTFFFKVDQFTDNFATRLSDSSLSDTYDDISSGLDQKQKNNITILLSYSLTISPFILLILITLINSSIQNKNSLFISLEKQIDQIEKLQKQVTKFTSSFSRHSNFSSKNKAGTYFKNVLREFNLPNNAVSINKIDESFIGDLKQIYIELNFNQLGKEELSKLIKTIKNKLKAKITNISIRSDKASKLAIGLIHMEFITK